MVAAASMTDILKKEFARSFHPRDWYDREDARDDLDATDYGVDSENRIMWVYQLDDGTGNWVVGFFTPTGDWVTESSYDKKADAAQHVHYLNGGSLST